MRPIPAEMLTDFAQFPAPATFARATRMATRFRLGDRFNPPINLVIFLGVPAPEQKEFMEIIESYRAQVVQAA